MWTPGARRAHVPSQKGAQRPMYRQLYTLNAHTALSKRPKPEIFSCAFGASESSAPPGGRASHQQTPPPPSLYKVPTYSTRAGAAPRAPGGARHEGGNRAVNSQPRTGQLASYGDVKSSYGGGGGAGRWDTGGCATGALRSANRQGGEQHRHTERGSHTRRDTADKEEGHSEAGEATRTAGTGNQNGGGGRACAWEAATTKGMAWPASPVATGCQGNPCSTGGGCLPQPRWAVCATGAGAHP